VSSVSLGANRSDKTCQGDPAVVQARAQSRRTAKFKCAAIGIAAATALETALPVLDLP